MKILAINSSYRPDGDTARLTRKALEGAASAGAETEHVQLIKKDVRYCTTCRMCYRDTEDNHIAPCSVDDDVHGILEGIRDADGILFSSPVHAGLANALMFTFLERALFTMTRPTGTSKGVHSCPEPRLTDRGRAVATLVCAGGTPKENRATCDMVTPLLTWYGCCISNGLPVGNMYAHSHFSKELTDEDWEHPFLLRVVPESQFKEAYDLGVQLAETIKADAVKPYDPKFFEEVM